MYLKLFSANIRKFSYELKSKFQGKTKISVHNYYLKLINEGGCIIISGDTGFTFYPFTDPTNTSRIFFV